jgi:hypothetical protein
MNIREIRWEGVDWMHLAQGRDQWRAVVNMVMDLRVSGWKFLDYVSGYSFSRTLLHGVVELCLLTMSYL